MLARAAATAARAAVLPRSNRTAAGQVRYGSNLKAIKMRIASTQNFAKITKSMKMVAASKVRKLEEPMVQSRPLAAATLNVFKDVDTEATQEAAEKPEAAGNSGEGEAAKEAVSAEGKHLVLALSSDRGLCGGVNTQVVKRVRALLGDLGVSDGQEAGQEARVKVNIVGEKARAAMVRDLRWIFETQTTEVGKSGRPSFDDACIVADEALAVPHDTLHIVFNKYISAMAYETTHLPITGHTSEDARMDAKFETEATIQAEMMRNLSEFHIACTVYNALLEAMTTEMAQRMSAMDNANRNASDMMDRLTVQYNRGRQASITTELIEIISGAESLKG